MRKACLDMVYELARNDERILFIGSDLGFGTMQAFRELMPDRFFMEGISEAHVVGMAAGLALEGKIPYVNTIASFITRRCFEQIAVDICLHQANVRLIGNGGGLVYAPLGPTHMTTEDIALMRALPGMTVIAPADAQEMRKLMPLTVDYPGPIYIRLAKGYDPIVSGNEPFSMDRAGVMQQGKDAVVITTGITLGIATEAAAELSKEGICTGLLHVPVLKPLDVETILDMISAVPIVVTVEEHSTIGGLGSAVAEIVAEASFRPTKRFRRVGIPDCFPDEYGSQASLMTRFNITSETICRLVRELSESHTDSSVDFVTADTP